MSSSPNLQGNPIPAGAIGSFQFDPAPWQYRPNLFDVDASGAVVPLDVLKLINEINLRGTRRLDLPPVWQESPPPYFDINGDNWVTPLDVLLVINHINARSAAGGEPLLAGVVAILGSGEEQVAWRFSQVEADPTGLTAPLVERRRRAWDAECV